MSYTAHTDPEQVKERFDDPDVLRQKAKQIAQWIQQSKHAIAFSGAGVSTSAGIPDFRGPQGVWTLRAQGKTAKSRNSSLQAIPTPTHMSLVKLTEMGIVKHVISQNTDGLHRKSGLDPSKLSELHGNSNIEVCTKCNKEYLRDFRAVASYAVSVHDHITSRHCDKCGGPLRDTIINFKESLPRVPLETGFNQAEVADLCIVLGSSLTVSPACDMPARVAERRKKLVICNLQRTPLDDVAAMKVYAKTDDLMTLIMEELNIPIPAWKLHRRVEIKYKHVFSPGPKGQNFAHAVSSRSLWKAMSIFFHAIYVAFAFVISFFTLQVLSTKKDKSNNYIRDHHQLSVRGIDWEGIHASILQQVDIRDSKMQKTIAQEPFTLQSKEPLSGPVKVTLHFMGHYAEPDLELVLPELGDSKQTLVYEMDYNPYTRSWDYRIADPVLQSK